MNLHGNTDAVQCVASLNNIVVSGGRDNLIRIWELPNDLTTLSPQQQQCLIPILLEGHQDFVTKLCLFQCPDTKKMLLASYSEDATIRVWDWKERKCISVLGISDYVISLLFHGILMCGTAKASLYSLDYHNGKTKLIVARKNIDVNAATEEEDKHVSDVKSECIQIIANAQSHGIAMFNSDRKELCLDIYWNANKELRDKLDSYKESTTVSLLHQIHEICDNSSEQSAQQSDTIQKCWVLRNGFDNVWKLLNPKYADNQGNGQTAPVQAYCLSLCVVPKKYVVIGKYNGSICILDYKTGKELKTLTGHRGWVRNITYKKSVDTIFSVSDDMTARLWDIQSGMCLRITYGHTDEVYGIAVSDHILVTGGRDSTVRLVHFDKYFVC